MNWGRQGKYLVRNRLGVYFLRAIDWALSLKQRFGSKTRSDICLSKVKKILVCHLAHMGDVVLSTAFLAALKQEFPNSQIDVLLGSWSQPVVKGLLFVDQIHVLDHWKLNRSAESRLKKVWHYLKQRFDVISEIRLQAYDIAIDLYPYFPNSIPILWSAGIPLRLGFTSGGFGSLLTHSLDWEDCDRSIVDDQLRLLQFLNLRVPVRAQPVLSDVGGTFYKDMQDKYCVFHMGAGLSVKEWPEEHWKAVLDHCVKEGYVVLFTGKGQNQKRAIQRVIQGVDRAVDLSDLLDWEGFVSVIRHAQFMISVDSVSGHIASAFEVPTISLFTGMDRLNRWKPINSRSIVLTKTVPCAPCFKRKGCLTMECIRGITPEEVIRAMNLSPVNF